MLNVSVEKTLDKFSLNAGFESDAGVIALFGRSGSGKTTLLNMIAGLTRPERGAITINGECLYDSARNIDMPIAQRRVGYVFQEGRLFPHLTVRKNLRYGYDLAPQRNRYVELNQVVELLGLEHLLERRPANLSGGEKQRVAIGRALLASPRVLLMDEPLVALDGWRKNEVLRYIERLHEEIRIPIVYVTHVIEEIVHLADDVVVLAEGRVVASGAITDIMGHSELHMHTVRFEGGSVIDAKVAAQDLDYDLTTVTFADKTLTVPGADALVGEQVRIRIRARDVSIALAPPVDISILNVLAARVISITEEEGASANVKLDVGGATLVARLTRFSIARLGLQPNQRVYALIKAVSLDQSHGVAPRSA